LAPWVDGVPVHQGTPTELATASPSTRAPRRSWRRRSRAPHRSLSGRTASMTLPPTSWTSRSHSSRRCASQRWEVPPPGA